MSTYTTLSGEAVTLGKLSPEVASFVDRVKAAVADPTVSTDQIIELVYGLENPILEKEKVPGHALVTRAVLDNPVYHILSDLVGVKRVQLGQLDMKKVDAAFCISVNDAAEQLGLTPAAVRAAISAKKLAAHMRNGQWYTRAEAIAAYKVSGRGRKKTGPKVAADVPKGADTGRDVQLRYGNSEGVSLSVRLPDGTLLVVEPKEGNITPARLPEGWTEALVRTTQRGDVTAYLIEPGTAEQELSAGELFVRGPFAIKDQQKGKKAAELWKQILGQVPASGQASGSR